MVGTVSRASRGGDGAVRLETLRWKRSAWLLVALFVLNLVGASPSIAAPAGPHWNIVSESEPTFFESEAPADAYTLIVRNDGGAPTLRESTVTVTDALPSGVTATKFSARGEAPDGASQPRYNMTCPEGHVQGLVTCTYAESASRGPVLAGTIIVLTITVSIPKELNPITNTATVSGGGAQSASTEVTTPIEDSAVPFGLSFFDVDVAAESGYEDTQAGSHPYELTASFAFNVSAREDEGTESPLADAAPKDLELTLPPGLSGNPAALPQCSEQSFLEAEGLDCPDNTQVGIVRPAFYGSFSSAVYPVFNIAPPPGQPAELGFSVAQVGHVPIFFQIRNDNEYRLKVDLNNIPETGPLQGAILTLWGVPADASHDLERKGTLAEAGPQHSEVCEPSVEVRGGVETQQGCPSDAPAKPFLTLPSECRAEPRAAVVSDSWQHPGQLPLAWEPGQLPPVQEPIVATSITGCGQLSFSPSLTLAPETTQAGAPSGYTVEVHVPQNEDPTGLATPDLREAVVTLPAGVVVSPSSADGLQGCTPEQFGLRSPASATCPAQSQIGSVRISTPLLSSPLEGHVFIAEPECHPCTPVQAREGKLVRLLLQAQGSGVTVKLEGAASIDQSTGQLTWRFEESPQLPFEDLRVTFDGGPRAPLANPSTCGVALAASSSLTPYSSEMPAEPSSEPFEVSGCPPPRFHPSLLAGTTDNQAGAFSPTTVTLSRTDGDEDLKALTVHLPPGLLGMLSNVPLCAQAEAQAGACPGQSEIGGATVAAGPGADPLFLPGSVYLTGPYDGAPFGLSIVVPAQAGPLDLGMIDIRASVNVDPSSAALSIASGPLPQRVDGIPLQIKTVNLDIDREGFTFNPSDCQPLAVEGVLESNEGATAQVTSPFRAANCAKLPFKPKLTALTHASTSKAGGAYLHMRIVFPPGARANVAKLKVDLPRQLRARLTTLQQACVAAVFAVDPASCPAQSVVGSVTVLTPVLRHGLVGPVYLVSHAGASAPSLEFVLQGEGVTIDVAGQASVEHGVLAGIFSSLPDVPFSTLGLVLTEGPHSLLAANLPARAHASMCGQRLTMPTAITAQNGAVIRQSTRLLVSGCARRRRRLQR
jgi:uncharacterized repeat protein (TIGR01451 family)